ncbi:MAG TPA: hypothetical protein VFT50_00950 [Baekduia sp.]|nr:hypothetical protein [Baekduia sp.]
MEQRVDGQAGRRPGCPRRRTAPGGRRPSGPLALFLLNAIGYLIAAGVAGTWSAATGGWWAHWLALHLAFVGAISLMVLGVGQFFATAFLMTTPASARMVAAQLAAWNAGTLAVAVGVPQGVRALSDAGAGLLLVGLALFAVALRGLTRRSLQRSHWAVRWYLASAAFLGVGAVVGALMAAGTAVGGGSLLGAHVALNVGGWFGTAIVGTLHTFYPSLTHSTLRHPRLQAPTFAWWCGGVGLLALGYGTGLAVVVLGGWLALVAAAALLTVNLAASRRAASELRLPARLIGAAQPLLLAGLALGLAGAVAHGADAPVLGPQRGALAELLLAGWLGMTVAGSVLHLLMVLARVRTPGRPLPPPRPGRDVAITAVAVAGVVAGAVAQIDGLEGLSGPSRAALLAACAVVALLSAAELGQLAAAWRRRRTTRAMRPAAGARP